MKKTPEQERSPSGIWDAMSDASDKFVKAVHTKDFDKYLAVANPKNGDDFFREVKLENLYVHNFPSFPFVHP
jgi:hypothetical protein